MAKQRSPNRDKAFRLWLESGKKRTLADIASELGVPSSKVRKWKTLDNWEGDSSGALHDENKWSAPPKQRVRGGQSGNNNALGHGAPEGNKNNFKHGIYESIYWDTLDDDERRMLENMRFDEEERLLEEQIMLLTVRERRLLRRIEKQQGAKGGLALDSVTKRTLETTGNIVKGNKQTQTETTTRTISTFEVVQKLEAELTKVQARKTRCIEALSKLRLERRKLEESDRGSGIAEEWIAGLDGDWNG